MKPEQWQQINTLFHAALEREPDERAAFLAHACLGDERLRREVESLIASHEPSDSFIDSLAPDLAAGLLAETQARLAVGLSIGHYKVLALLARAEWVKCILPPARDLTARLHSSCCQRS